MKKSLMAAALAATAFISVPAAAATFLVEVGAPLGSPNGGGNADTPKFRVVNTSGPSATQPYLLSLLLSLDATTTSTITGVSNFGGGSFGTGVDDSPSMSSPTSAFTSKSATLTYDPTDFDPGAYSTFSVNFGPGTTDFRTALFNGTNTLTALFSDQTSAQVKFSGDPTASSFSFDSAAVTPPVPEPATWAMMLVGFGFVGSAMRRRKTAAAKVNYSFA